MMQQPAATKRKLRPEVVARAARALFGTGHGEAIVFFFLKAQGASADGWINVTSSNDPPSGLLAVAGQPDHFDDLVKRHIDDFATSSSAGSEGLPTRPGARGTADNYTMYFPITDENQYILRKRDCNRNAIYSNITGGRNALNADRARREDIFELRSPSQVGQSGVDLRFKPDYAYAAHWYYGPRRGTPMRVPLRPLAVWMHRTADLDPITGIDQLVAEAIHLLHLTEQERWCIFDEDYPFTIADADYTDQWRLEDYFKALCLPSSTISVPRPTVARKWLEMDREQWHFKSQILGLEQRPTALDPERMARSLLASGERNLLLYGPPRTSKSHFAIELAAEYLEVDRSKVQTDPRFKRVQFHQGWSYGDFIRKVMPVPKGGGLAFERSNGVFLQHCLDHAGGPSVFIIDEINRANLANVFGEAFQVVEKGYRGIPIDLPGSMPGEESVKLTVPPGLLLLATANDLDKTTLPLDFAFLGRFATVDFPVVPRKTYDILKATAEWTTGQSEDFVELLGQVEKIAGFPVGHAYFYTFGPPSGVHQWYRVKLRPALKLFLTQYKQLDLVKIDDLFAGWGRPTEGGQVGT